jgi:hypothetical protein
MGIRAKIETQSQQLKPMAVRAKVGHPHNINIEGQLIASKEKEEMS